MENDLERFGGISDVVRKQVDLPVARPAGWHNPLRVSDTSSGRIARHLDLNYRTKPQRIKDLVKRALGYPHAFTKSLLKCLWTP